MSLLVRLFTQKITITKKERHVKSVHPTPVQNKQVILMLGAQNISQFTA